jgi:hypothetical protein
MAVLGTPVRPRRRTWIAVTGLLMFGSANASETIGPYTIVATPTSAVLVSGGGPGFDWLNVVNAPVTLNDALTGFSVIDDGYANAASGSTIRLTFAPGVLRNHAGPDLVLFDANNDLNVYLVSTSHDGFTHMVASAASTDTGIDRLYFYGGQGPTSWDVMAGTIDLSSFNVPEGVSVSQIDLFTEGPANDPLGLGVLASPAALPAISHRGLWIVTILLAAAGTLLQRRRQPA